MAASGECADLLKLDVETFYFSDAPSFTRQCGAVRSPVHGGRGWHWRECSNQRLGSSVARALHNECGGEWDAEAVGQEQGQAESPEALRDTRQRSAKALTARNSVPQHHCPQTRARYPPESNKIKASHRSGEDGVRGASVAPASRCVVVSSSH
jgi:hypothetical protein